MAEAFILDAAYTTMEPGEGALEAALVAVVDGLLARCELPPHRVERLSLATPTGAAIDGRHLGLGTVLGTRCVVDDRRGVGGGLAAVLDAAMAVSSGYRDAILVVGADDGLVRTPRSPPADVAWRHALPTAREHIRLAAARGELDADTLAHVVQRSMDRCGELRDLAAHVDPGLAALRGPAPDGGAQPVAGASAVLLCSTQLQAELDLRPRARVVTHAERAGDPGEGTLAAAAAVEWLLTAVQMQLEEVQILELGARSAAEWVQLAGRLGAGLEQCNVAGDALARGHLGAAAGPQLVATALAALHSGWDRYAMVVQGTRLGAGRALLMDKEMYW